MNFRLNSITGKMPNGVGVPVTVHRSYIRKVWPPNPKHVSELKGQDTTIEYDEAYTTVEINSIEDLVKLMNVVVDDIIISRFSPPGLNVEGTITIYDDYAE